ncbi:histidine kinase N-terminal 7TM domain-containing protein [Halegenticoccus tardaugens]|uniref:histidine kinase N-terminal 7TM domain-containing protein n=1 Tax=Halegenticoccus tardaugens TaxID=2071624 RepID=UPI00100B4470|nr:histidine kinase N-terminal 7TM domain-containing protein [Halegenticoccus tardaugens]
MFQGVTPFGAALVVAASAGTALLAALAALAWHRRPRAGAAQFAVMMALNAIWLFFVALGLLAPTPEAAVRRLRLAQSVVVFVPVAWLAFSLAYADRGDRLSPPTVGALLAVPALVAALTATETGLVVSRAIPTLVDGVWTVEYAYGPVGLASVAYAYALIAAGFAVLFRLVVGSGRYHRRQAGLVVGAAVAPLAANVAFVAGVGPVPAFDFTPFAVVVEGIVLFVALFDFRLFDIAPVARATLVDTMSDGVVVLDDEGRVVDSNPAAATLAAGDSGDEPRRVDAHIGADVADALPPVGAWLDRADDRDADRGTVTFRSGDGARHFDVRITRLSATPIRPSGRLVVLREVTERTEREETLEALQSASRALMGAESERAVCETATAAARDAFRLDYAAVYLRDDVAPVLVPVAHTDGLKRLYDPVPSFRVDEGLVGEAFEAGETRVYADVRASAALRDEWTPLCGAIMAPLGDRGVLAVGTTESTEFDDTLVNFVELLAATTGAALSRAERECELAERNERLDEFAGLVSHDLRNPLAIATGYLDLLREECGDSENLDRVEDALSRIDDITADMLALARNGEREFGHESVRLLTVVEQAWNTVATGDARLSCALDDFTVDGDPGLLQQSFENLFRNAVEHAGPAVSVTVGPLADGTGFFVEDDGPGVPADERAAVFERGYSTGDGTGLGLGIVRDVVDAHGWRIHLAAGDRGGARFEVFVPDA